MPKAERKRTTGYAHNRDDGSQHTHDGIAHNHDHGYSPHEHYVSADGSPDISTRLHVDHV